MNGFTPTDPMTSDFARITPPAKRMIDLTDDLQINLYAYRGHALDQKGDTPVCEIQLKDGNQLRIFGTAAFAASERLYGLRD